MAVEPDPNISPQQTFGSEGIYLALSGGGFRATAIHLGAILCFLRSGIHTRIRVVSSVSGGAILAGHLAKWWSTEAPPNRPLTPDETSRFSAPLLRLLTTNLRTKMLTRILRATLTSNKISPFAEALDSALFNGYHLKDITADPLFIFCATDSADGSPVFISNFAVVRNGFDLLHRSAPMRVLSDRQDNPTFPSDTLLSSCVAASAAHPFLFRPVPFSMSAEKYRRYRRPFEEGYHPIRVSSPSNVTIRLTDGGLSDNLGIQPLLTEHTEIRFFPRFGMTPGSTSFRNVIALDAGRASFLRLYPPRGLRLRTSVIKAAISWSMNQREVASALLLESVCNSNGIGCIYYNPNKKAFPPLGLLTDTLMSIRTDIDALSRIELFALLWLGYLSGRNIISDMGLSVRQSNEDQALKELQLCLPCEIPEELITRLQFCKTHLTYSHLRFRLHRELCRWLANTLDSH